MTLEEHIYQIVNPTIAVFPDAAPMGTPLPYCTYQRFGGRSITYMDHTLPDKKNAVVQFNIWASTALEASNLIMQIEKILVANKTVTASAISEAESAFSDDDEAEIKGRMQDFSIWYPTN